MPTKGRASLGRELKAVEEDILRMGNLVDEAVARSMQALARRDLGLARQIVEEDVAVNAVRFRVEEACLALIATQQPAAGDLRAIVAAMNIVVDLERMADHAAGIARIVQNMGEEPLLKPLIDLPRMAELCRGMTRSCLEAFIARDAAAARQATALDDQIDALYQQVFREILSFVVEDPATTSRGLHLEFAAHNFERIGDRATNIAERVIFMASGEMRELNPEPLEASDLQ